MFLFEVTACGFHTNKTDAELIEEKGRLNGISACLTYYQQTFYFNF